MRGSFKLVDCRTLTAEGRQGCRVISLDCSAGFLEWLATKPKNHKFGFLYSYVYINGGKRADSITQYNTPALSPEASRQIHKWKGGEVMKTAFQAWGIPQAFASSTRYVIRNKTLCKLTIYCCLTLAYHNYKLRKNSKKDNANTHSTCHSLPTGPKTETTPRSGPGRTQEFSNCLLYTSPSPRDRQKSRMPSSA